ncbi:MAG: NUDIX domain-containing protein [Clostridia bacterium]|nr:NUDIX domain-containing protein [Clostridia bacterium]
MILERSCGAVVYKRTDKRVLYLIEHMARGHVSLPKGHVEDGETEEQTARREIKEETNLDVYWTLAFARRYRILRMKTVSRR